MNPTEPTAGPGWGGHIPPLEPRFAYLERGRELLPRVNRVLQSLSKLRRATPCQGQQGASGQGPCPVQLPASAVTGKGVMWVTSTASQRRPSSHGLLFLSPRIQSWSSKIQRDGRGSYTPSPTARRPQRWSGPPCTLQVKGSSATVVPSLTASLRTRKISPTRSSNSLFRGWGWRSSRPHPQEAPGVRREGGPCVTSPRPHLAPRASGSAPW